MRAGGTRGSVVIAGAVARRPDRGGHAWAFLQYVLGFQRLGWDVLWLDSLDDDPGRSDARVREFTRFVDFADLHGHASLLVGATEPRGLAPEPAAGLDRRAVLSRVRSADLFINVMGYIRAAEVLAAAPRTLFLDIDPGFGQMWEAQGLARLFYDHDAYASVGERIGAADCHVPTLGLDWIPTPPPVVLERFPIAAEPGAAWTSVCSWRGPFAPIEHDGRRYGLRAHEMRRFLDLPLRTGRSFCLAVDIDPADETDRQRLIAAGWELVDPTEHAGDVESYRRFIRGSAGEILVAKNLYVDTRSGWFSDRSVCYLASGRPVVAQDTGWSDRHPSGEGLLRFETPDEAAAAIRAVSADPARHGRAAREIAEARFDSDRVLMRLVERATSTAPLAPAAV